MRHGRRRPVATITVKISTALCRCRVADVPIIATTARILDLGTMSELDSDDSDSSHGDDDETLVNQSTTQGVRSSSFGVQWDSWQAVTVDLADINNRFCEMWLLQKH
jgi:hypothetical protein